MGNFLLVLIGLGLLVWAANWLLTQWQKSRLKSVGGEITPGEFEQNMRKAQIIDLREKKDFDAGHILGARDLPYTQLKQRMIELRKDLPVYMYDLTGAVSVKAARRMKKAGFEHLYFLKGGYDNWSGKTKKAKEFED
ncbi:rhodanese-like domain-containing protein [Lacticaseibacillus hegangensis]|uniref:Rhodanese-like domain-containing protein n=1 Tax=Lacticaseibacillus hegangensis TaxID=2486010 RepID=A0ABW4CU48_9LACO|nr:rhodanese-like domain-containing protein [Lacticaseibacillus hegangensis]